MRRRLFLPILLLVCAFAGLGYAAENILRLHLGKQKDGGFVVSSVQRIEPGAVAFDGRPTDIALHPSGEFYAVLGQNRLFLGDRSGTIAGSDAKLSDGAGYHGLCWTPDGKRLFASVSDGKVAAFTLNGKTLVADGNLPIEAADTKGDPRPGGMCITKDGSRLFVALMDRNAVAEVDLSKNLFVRQIKVQMLPFTVALSSDESKLIVSNWGGREPQKDDRTSQTADALIVVDPRGAPSNGTVSIVNRAEGTVNNVPVGLHPTGIAIDGDRAYVANAASDSITVLDIKAGKVERTIGLKWGTMNRFGAMPCALTLDKTGSTLYICNGGDNALCQVDLAEGKVVGYRPAGYFPVNVVLDADGKTAFVVNTKGNGSVRRTAIGQVGNAHDYQGTVSIIDLTSDLSAASKTVAANNGWNRDRSALTPNLKVYKGAIKHVLYIIKENRTYDEVFGDLPQGNGDPKLVDIGRKLAPNQHAIVEQFALFDNGYVSGTNSADGHAWSNQALANDYLEHFYTGYRTYPDDGDCAMSIPTSGNLWDAAAKKGKTIRVYGEFADDALAKFDPPVNTWLALWNDRKTGKKTHKISVATRVESLKPYLHPHVVYWPLWQSDQERADLFIEEYNQFSKKDRVPNLMILSLPCDHTEGRSPGYPKAASMIADNDLAVGRVVEAISHSPQWKDTCIFVIEDDAQSGPDHVDGHRTVYMAISPYIRHKFVDSSLYTTVSMLRSIELMLGLDPMNRFDALTPPLSACFTDTPDLTPFRTVNANVALDDMNLPTTALSGKEKYWTQVSQGLDFSGADRADSEQLNRVIWHSLRGMETPYPTDPLVVNKTVRTARRGGD